MTTPNPTPDLSPAALALAFRQEATVRKHLSNETTLHHLSKHHAERAAYLESLADALETSPEVSRSDLTVYGAPWEDRMQRAANRLQDVLAERGAKPSRAGASDFDWLYATNAALVAAFPELAPEAE